MGIAPFRTRQKWGIFLSEPYVVVAFQAAYIDLSYVSNGVKIIGFIIFPHFSTAVNEQQILCYKSRK